MQKSTLLSWAAAAILQALWLPVRFSPTVTAMARWPNCAGMQKMPRPMFHVKQCGELFVTNT